MKLWLSYFLIVLFSFQALPVKELGKLLIKKAVIEQVQDEADDATDTSKLFKEKSIEKVFLQHGTQPMVALFADDQVKVALHNLRLFEDHFHPEIPTPPPNNSCS